MNKSETLLKELVTLKMQYPGASWMSETDSQIAIKRYGWWNLFNKKRMPDGEEVQYLDTAKEQAEGILQTFADVASPSADDRKLIASQRGVLAICDLLLKQDELIGIRKQTAPGTFRIQILACFGPWAYVGVSFTVAET